MLRATQHRRYCPDRSCSGPASPHACVPGAVREPAGFLATDLAFVGLFRVSSPKSGGDIMLPGMERVCIFFFFGPSFRCPGP